MQKPMFATIKTLLKLFANGILTEERLSQALFEVTEWKESAL